MKRRTSFRNGEEPSEHIRDRLGLNNRICTSCNANNSKDADKCRKCGCTQLRRKKKDFSDE